jgi:hypothetical protein
MLFKTADAELAIVCNKHGAVDLYYDNSKKLETQADGILVTGKIQPTSHIYQNDNLKHHWGSSQDLSIFHDGSHSRIHESGTGDLRISGSAVHIQNQAQSENMLKCFQDGAVELYHDNNKKLETTSSGINVTGAITVNGSALGSGGLKQTQFVSINETSGETSFSTSYNEVLSQNITPSDSSNKVCIFSAVMQYIANTSGNLYALPQAFRKLTRTISGTETTLIEDSVLSQRDNYNGTKYQEGMSSLAFQDSPNTTSQVTYRIYFKRNSNTNSAHVGHGMMTLMETAV